MESRKCYSELIWKAETETQTERMDIWIVAGREEVEGQEERRWDELRDWD